jgi:hypothetical protein
LEWISSDRECRQLVAWHGALATVRGQHRATVVHKVDGVRFRSYTGSPDVPVQIVEPARYVFDIDPAVRAAHLTGALAAEHSLAALSAGPTYLTGDLVIDDDLLSCFRVEVVLPLRVRLLAEYLRARSIGRLEIKKRGVDTAPEKLRRDLKLRGDNSATLLITNIAGRPASILTLRVSG